MQCKSIGCKNAAQIPEDFCKSCLHRQSNHTEDGISADALIERYPEQYKDVSALNVIDPFQIHALFNIQDPTGCIQHASRKLLLGADEGQSTERFLDVMEARDALTRWLHIYSHLATEP